MKEPQTTRDAFINLLIEEGLLKNAAGLMPHDTSPKRHGICCNCGTCGYQHDDCVCVHNEVWKKVEAIQ